MNTYNPTQKKKYYFGAAGVLLLVALFCTLFYGKENAARASEEDFPDVEVINWDTITIGTVSSSSDLPMAGIAAYITGEVKEELNLEDMLPQAGAALCLLGEVQEEIVEESEYANLAIANVYDYVNVREQPNTSSAIVGKMYSGSVAQIQEVDGEWFKVLSGELEGYIKSEYFIYGEEAALVMGDYVRNYAYIDVDQLNVRTEPSQSSDRIGYFTYGESAEVLEDDGEWLKVRYAKNKTGYIYKDYATVEESFIYAKTTAQEEAEQLVAAQFEQRVTDTTVPTNNTPQRVTLPPSTYTTDSELRNSLVNYALQFVGCPYVMGGNSLTNGTDCSGFTKLIYQQFGYNISRIPSGQLATAGRSVSLDQAQPGDIICYSNGGTCGHVGIYIGNGQIVHAAGRSKGICVANVGMMPIMGVKNVID